MFLLQEEEGVNEGCFPLLRLLEELLQIPDSLLFALSVSSLRGSILGSTALQEQKQSAGVKNEGSSNHPQGLNDVKD